jgi:anti-sigma regulatory factor (Ser/Thr protein kinase)
VRRAVSTWIAGHPRRDDVLLAITELVNNAVLHGGLAPGDDLTITVGPDGNSMRFTVGHAGVLFEPDELPPSSREPGASRGMAIVDRIADVWGVDSDGVEVTAWFEVGPA